ncbi:MAG TPA: chalcone isomerase family protein [Bdellovibrionota bacterium]
MNTIFRTAAALAILSPGLALASVLTISPGAQEIEGVKVSESAKLKMTERNYALKVVGAGLRYKKVALFKAKVYVGELMMDAPEKFQKTKEGALGSLAAQKAVAVRMTFLRDVDGEKISSSFKDALKENSISLDSAHVKAFLDAVKTGGEVKEKTTLVVLGEKLPSGKEAVSFENSEGKLSTVVGEPGLIREVFSIWLGKIDDSGLEHLRDGFLGVKD